MNTPHQYMLITAPPEKEKAFSTLKAKYGTTFAFHGSPGIFTIPPVEFNFVVFYFTLLYSTLLY